MNRAARTARARRGPGAALASARSRHPSDLDVSTSAADVQAQGRLGDVEAKTASGDLSFAVVEGSFKGSTASGDVVVGEIGRNGSIKTASGDTHVGRALGPLVAR